jgi:RNA-splicing ligase RtcB
VPVGRWSQGFGFLEDLEHIESGGALPNADPSKVSKEAYERGSDELGTVGSGNHFVEVQVVDEVYDEDIAERLGLKLGQVCIMVHSGSRGFGHQVCVDYLKVAKDALRKYKIDIPDMQLACMPFKLSRRASVLFRHEQCCQLCLCQQADLGLFDCRHYKAILWSLLEGSGLQAYLRFSPQHSQVGKA